MSARPRIDAATPDEEPLPPQPDRPDCCNGGCAVCVLEGFDDELELWRRACDEILARRAPKTEH